MAVYTPLTCDQIEQLLIPYQIGKVLGATGIDAGSINTLYDVSTSTGRYILRILEDRPLADAKFEADFLEHLAEQQLAAPVMVTVAGMAKSPIVSLTDKKHLSLFHYIEGRELSPKEITAKNCGEVGVFLGKLHATNTHFKQYQADFFGPAVITPLLKKCLDAAAANSALSQLDIHSIAQVINHHYQEYSTLDQEEERLPQGIIHADLFIDNARFQQDKDRWTLAAVLDFEMAATGLLIYDLAVAVADWCFIGNAFQAKRAHALIKGYQTHRTLSIDEQNALYHNCLFATARFALTRFHNFEVNAQPEVERVYKSYQDYISKMNTLQQIGPEQFASACQFAS